MNIACFLSIDKKQKPIETNLNVTVIVLLQNGCGHMIQYTIFTELT